MQMTLTAPACTMGPHVAHQAEWAIRHIEGVADVEIEMVFDPPGSRDLISDVARPQPGV